MKLSGVSIFGEHAIKLSVKSRTRSRSRPRIQSQRCHGQRKVREKRKIFQGQGKVREFFKKSGKIFDIVKVSEKSGNSVFRFLVRKFSSRF